MLNTSENLPEKCISCANNNASAVHKKCKFCQDLRFSESLLCHLNRSVQSPDKFICYAFRQKLINVNKPMAEKACLEIVPTDSFRADKIKKLLDSDKAKYRNSLAVQRLQRDPDGVYLDLKYHFVWNVLCRRAVFENSADYFDFTSDLYLTCGEMAGGYAQVLWLAAMRKCCGWRLIMFIYMLSQMAGIPLIPLYINLNSIPEKPLLTVFLKWQKSLTLKIASGIKLIFLKRLDDLKANFQET
jgi:hypothetical protein